MIYKKIIRHGNCFAVILPAAWCRLLELNRGDYVAMGLADRDLLVIKKANSSMADVLKNKVINKNNE